LFSQGVANQKSNHLFRATRPIEKQKKRQKQTETHSESQAHRRTDRQN